MAEQEILDTYELFFQRIANYNLYNPATSELTTWLESLVTIDISLKADKVLTPIDGHFAGLDANGNLTDLGLFPTDFIRNGVFFDDRYYLKEEVDTLLDSRIPVITLEGTTENVVLTKADGTILYDSGISITNIALNSTLAGYYTKAEMDIFLDAKAGKPTQSLATGEVLIWDDTLKIFGYSGIDLADIALISTLTDYYTKTETDGLLNNKVNVVLGAIEDNVVTFDTGGQIKESAVAITSLALVSDLALKYDEISATTGNFASFGSSGAVLADSGFSASSFVLLSAMTDYSLAPKFLSLQLASDGFYALSANNTTGATTTPNGTLTVVDNNGHTFYLLTAATA